MCGSSKSVFTPLILDLSFFGTNVESLPGHCHLVRGNKGTNSFMALLTGYFDESGIHENEHGCVIAGFVGNDAQWGTSE